VLDASTPAAARRKLKRVVVAVDAFGEFFEHGRPPLRLDTLLE
jgi:hypothetical protein